MKHLLITLITFLSVQVFAQLPDLDSLKNDLPLVNGEDKIYLLSDISYYSSYSNSDTSLFYAKKCLQAAFNYGDSLLIAEGYNSLAIALYAQSDFKSSLQANFAALKIRKNHGDDYSLMSSYSKIANCYFEVGEYEASLTYNLKALELGKRNDWVAQVGQILNNLAEVLKIQENYEDSEKYLLQAIEISSKSNQPLSLAKAYLNLGVNYSKTNNFKKSDSLYQLSYNLIKGENYLDMEAGLMINWGVITRNQAPEKSLNYYRRALHLYNQTGEIYGLGLVSTNLGYGFLRANQPDSAIFYFKKGLALAHESESLDRIIDAYQGLAYYYIQNNNYEQAFENDSLADFYSDSLYTLEKLKLTEELNTRYQTVEKEKQLAEQKIAIAQKESEVQLKNNWLLFFGFGSILLLILAILLYRQQKLKEERLERKVALEKSQALNKIQEEKLRISRDLHDNIGSQLTFMISTLDHLNYIENDQQRQEKLNSLEQFAKHTLGELRTSIWTLKTDEMHIHDFNAKVSEFIQQAKTACPHIQFLIETEDVDLELKDETVIHLFRVIQEAINNAIKYSEGNRITYTFKQGVFEISDNGIGFNPETVSKGNGIKNMQTRIEKINGQLTIISNNKGTKIAIKISGK